MRFPFSQTVFVVAAFSICLFAGCSSSPGEPVASLAPDASGEEILAQRCAGCHGANGQGGRAPNLAQQANHPADELHKIIHDGKGQMPAFKDQLSDAQIDKVVTYIKQLKKS